MPPNWGPDERDSGEWEDDADAPQERDLDDEDGDEIPTVPCPNCGQSVAEIAERCPHCGDWIVAGGGRPQPSRWLIAAALLAAAGLLAWQLL